MSSTSPKLNNWWFRILLTQVFDQYRENVRGIAMTLQDITRETELNEAKSQFISNVSHELRTPLFNIKSFIETLIQTGKMPPAVYSPRCKGCSLFDRCLPRLTEKVQGFYPRSLQW